MTRTLRDLRPATASDRCPPRCQRCRRAILDDFLFDSGQLLCPHCAQLLLEPDHPCHDQTPEVPHD